MLKLLELLEECSRGSHDLSRLLEIHCLAPGVSTVARWCERCGSAVVDVDYDGRTNPGQVMKMRSSEFLKRAIAAIHRQLLGELLTTLRADRANRLFGKGYGEAKLILAAQGGAPISEALAAKVRFLATVVRHLEGGYDNEGVNAWFERPRVQLGGRSPVQVLTESWDPAGKDAQSVLELARSLSSSPAT
ncbi:MAG: hypothetical protein HYT14_00605 [Candidatus Liptonbacteria bacterium]|nr:hypothetical protein [Candidatus Liptonbacteria bacterium]